IDEFKGGVNYDANDRFCLDGERLMPVGGHYRTERESLQKIEVAGGTASNPEFFVVTDKSGTVREYRAAIEAAIPKTAIRRLWALIKVKDPHGNYFSITYEKSDVHGDYRPASIAYTGNEARGLTPYNLVAFEYITRPDNTPLYEGGSVIRTLKLLSKIKSYAGATKVREYRLAYDPDGALGRSRLKSVQECGTEEGVCLPATVVGWNEAQTTSFDLAGNWTSSSETGVFAYSVADVNGDGKSDLVLQYDNGGMRYWQARLSTGSSFDVSGDWTSTSELASVV